MIDKLVLHTCTFTSTCITHYNRYVCRVRKWKNLGNYHTLVKTEKPRIFRIGPILTPTNRLVTPDRIVEDINRVFEAIEKVVEAKGKA